MATGRLDLASVSNYGGTGASVLLGNGDGTFQAARHSGIGSNSAPAVADLNVDGNIDRVKITPDSNLSVQLGDGAGTYQQTQVIVLPSQLSPGTSVYPAQIPTSVAFGDLNADGKLDLIAAGFDEEIVDSGLTYRQDHSINVLIGNRLSGSTNATLADGQGVGAIVDDEPRISVSDVTKAEGRKGKTTLFTFTVTLSAAYDQPVTMSFQTADGTAATGNAITSPSPAR